MNGWVLHRHRNLVVLLLRLLLLRLLLRVAGMGTPANRIVLRRLNLAHGRWGIDMRRRYMLGICVLWLPVRGL